jgi:hypothetical protein
MGQILDKCSGLKQQGKNSKQDTIIIIIILFYFILFYLYEEITTNAWILDT